MEKYQGFSQIVNDHFHARICNLDFQYINDDTISINIEYKDKFYSYCYGMKVDSEHKHVEFVCHDCLGHKDETHLKRNIEFEHGVEKLLSTF